jgi:hypothetical protein
MDLSQFDTTQTAEEGAVMTVTHPATGVPLEQDDGTPVTITLAGTDSERFRRAERQALNRRLQGPRRNQNVTAEELEANGINGLVACTLAWSGIVLDGESLACTPDNARLVYKRLPWLREQANEFTGQRANFLRASPKS